MKRALFGPTADVECIECDHRCTVQRGAVWRCPRCGSAVPPMEIVIDRLAEWAHGEGQ